MDTRVVVEDGLHNAFTDLIAWRGALWLVYVASPSHFASRHSQLVLLRSTDGEQWLPQARLNDAGQDIRDPKLAVIHDHLTLYALLNHSFDPLPTQTLHADSRDGNNWSELMPAGPQGWLLGKPKTADQKTWFAPAHHLKKGEAALLSSRDGLHWGAVSSLCPNDKADETAIEILPDGVMLSATRLEAGGGLFGSASAGTLLSSARPPYTRWAEGLHDPLARLDGPALIAIGGDCYAVGRSQPQVRGPFHRQGSIFSRKRTALFHLTAAGLVWLADLPSAGDTAYAGAVTWNDSLYISYYTSDPNRDVPWIVGMLRPTRIQLTRIPLPEILLLREGKK